MNQNNDSILTDEPLKIKLTDIAYQTIESDLSLFQLDSKNQLLNRIFMYHATHQMKKDDTYLKKVDKVIQSISLQTYQEEAIKAVLYEHMIDYEKTKSLKHISFRPHTSEIKIFHKMYGMAERLTNHTKSLPIYLSYVLDLYAKKNRAERTKIIFDTHYQTFHQALKQKKQLMIHTKHLQSQIYHPIDTLAIFDNEVILFACEDQNQSLKLIELSSIVTIDLLDTPSTFQASHKETLIAYKKQKINLSSFRSYFDDPEKVELLLQTISAMQ